ncbi:tetratricopeptide repeat protein [Lachnospiraceae bacterium LCP19S3_B12]
MNTLDKTEYHLKLDELTRCVQEQDFNNALQIAESIDWRRVKSIRTLSMVADIYEVNKDYRNCKDILLLAYDRASIGKSILYRLVEISLKLGEVDEAVDFYTEYTEVAPNDNSRYILKYKIYKARRSPLADQISILEEYKDKEYTERWAYELATLYSKAGDNQRCVDACDDLILWFSEGKYVVKAMELKMKYQPLAPFQQDLYEKEKYRYLKAERPKVVPPARPRVEKSPVRASSADSTGSQDVLKRMDQAGAAITRNVNMNDAMDEAAATDDSVDDYSITSREFIGKTANLREQLAKSIHEVFSGVKKEAPQVKDLGVSRELEMPEPEEVPENLLVQDLEPEKVEAEVRPRPEAARTILSRPEPKAETEEEQIEGQMSFADFDLDALLKETADSLSEEIASGDFDKNRQLTQAPAQPGPAETEEYEAGRSATGIEGYEPEPAAEVMMDVPKEHTAEAAAEAMEQEAAGEEDIPDLSDALEAEADQEVSHGTSEPENRFRDIHEFDEMDELEAGFLQPQQSKKPLYNEELEIPDPEPTPEEKIQRTIPLNKIGQNTIPVSIEDVLREETPEERRIRILNDAKPTRMSDDQRKIFTYFARIPGMDQQILEAINNVYEHAGEHTSRHGNIAVMGAEGTGKSRLTYGLIVAMCKDLGMDAAKIARLEGSDMNHKDPAKIVAKMSGGFLIIENAGDMTAKTIDKLNRAMEFRTDCMILIIEDEKANMRALLKQYPQFAGKFEQVISIPVFTNDELVTFARTYATENGCKMDEMGVLALYTLIGNNQSEEEPVTISRVKEMVDNAMARAKKGTRRFGRRGSGRDKNKDQWTVLYEKDFDV